MKMEHDKTQPGGVGPEHLVFITACQTSFFLSTWGLGTGGSSVSFLLRTMPSITPVDPESIIIPVCVCVTHLVHVTGPLHDVLEGSLTRDVIHQEDSLKRDVEEQETERIFKSLQDRV